ncbi:UV damage endonuclease UvdE [Kwoniella mangroviensis CBS 8886]|uniref:UV damage endonuclease UvdE n=1 Tax=Kwoniella mangroviensis CBS 8507 TaxID=1296122 RepID=UPI00080D7850|nr:UV damage endonuclease UvdE [Kwoniella mangroviensis CBS 8507]OCF67021.1 UV damage endonuclease UvdE [Kwoniella mangroviensis CBS 8507]OCF77985.1 UV damage endonuclease UvdE [Kwoniella mangroviensis CBS 8886]
MPPRRLKVIPPEQPGSPSQISTTTITLNPAATPKHTMINALEHMPPPELLKTERDTISDSDEALTPITSEQEEEVKHAVDKAVDRNLSKRKRGAAKKDISYVEEDQDGGSDFAASESELSEVEPESPKKRTPKKKATATPKKTKVKVEEGEGEGEGEEETPKKAKKVTPKKSRIAKDEPEYDEDGNEIVKKKRKPKVYPKKVYEIPDVERKTTTFRGRLGYACLNTVLRSEKPDSIFCSRTCRIASIEEEGMELPKGLALMNVRDLKTMIQWNEDNKIRFMRLSSEMFPFASHAKYGYDLAFADEGLKEAGALAKKYGHRLTMHPGQFTQLGSPKPNVIEASIRELNYQCEIMDRMGIGAEGVMIIHMGGIFGDKESTLARFKENYTTRLSEGVKKRLVLENDEICYNVDDLFPVCEELDIPIIFDYHHDWINPSSEPPAVLIPRIAKTWEKRGIPMKQHLSEPRPGAETVMERRAHADRCKSLPDALPDDVDLMIEAKDKEQAVFELYRIYGLEEVNHDSLRPPDPNPGMHTKGRKSSLKKKQKETGDVDSEGEPINLSDIEKEGDGGVGDISVVEGHVKNAINDAGMEVDGQTPPKKGKAKGKRKSVGGDDEGDEAKGDNEQGSAKKKKTTPKKAKKNEENKENVPDADEQVESKTEDVKEEPKKQPAKRKGRQSKEKAAA